MKRGTAPTFVIPGASRSGTTSLHHYLSEHPSIYLPPSKELQFFCREGNYMRGVEAYEANFSGSSGETAVGESSPMYFYHGKIWDDGKLVWKPDDDSAIRLSDEYPDLDIIITLRNPVTRAYSQYWKNVRQGRERTFSFRRAIEEELRGERSPEQNLYCWVYANRYPVHLRHWIECFGRGQIKFIVFEDWIERPEETLRELCGFLGVDPLDDWSRASQVKNASRTPRSPWLNAVYHDYLRRTGVGELLYHLNLRKGYPEMDADTRRFLLNVFIEDIHETEEIIGRDLNIWIDEIDPGAEA